MQSGFAVSGGRIRPPASRMARPAGSQCRRIAALTHLCRLPMRWMPVLFHNEARHRHRHPSGPGAGGEYLATI